MLGLTLSVRKAPVVKPEWLGTGSRGLLWNPTPSPQTEDVHTPTTDSI